MAASTPGSLDAATPIMSALRGMGSQTSTSLSASGLHANPRSPAVEQAMRSSISVRSAIRLLVKRGVISAAKPPPRVPDGSSKSAQALVDAFVGVGEAIRAAASTLQDGEDGGDADESGFTSSSLADTAAEAAMGAIAAAEAAHSEGTDEAGSELAEDKDANAKEDSKSPRTGRSEKSEKSSSMENKQQEGEEEEDGTADQDEVEAGSVPDALADARAQLLEARSMPTGRVTEPIALTDDPALSKQMLFPEFVEFIARMARWAYLTNRHRSAAQAAWQDSLEAKLQHERERLLDLA